MIVQGSLCLDPLPSILVQNFGMVSLGKGSSLRRVAMDGYNISWIPLHKKKQRKRCLPDNQLDKAALERGHGVITHSRQRTPSHHVSLQSRPAMASIQLFSLLSRIFFFASFDSWSCSSPPLPHDPALSGDFRNPHSLNSTYLHQRWKDGNKSYPSKDIDCPDTSMAGASA